MGIEELLTSTMPILYDTGCEEWPYAYAGTCFPVRYMETLFIVSADHRYRNHGISPERTLYPTPDDPASFFAFDLETHAAWPHAKDDKHRDQVLLRVARACHPEGETQRVPCLDLAESSNALLPVSGGLIDIRLRGYPFGCPQHAINYDAQKIRRQAYATNCHIRNRRSPFSLCYYVKMVTPIPTGMSPNGMSGTPAYGVSRLGSPAYCGTVIEYNESTSEYLVIGPEVLVNALRKLDREQGTREDNSR